MHHTLSRSRAALAVVAALMLTGCSNASSEEPAPEAPETLDQMVDEGLANAQSDFQRDVLQKAKETGEISEADWKEANNQKKECMAALGYDLEIVYEGSKVMWLMDLDEEEDDAALKKRDQASLDCSDKTNAYINEIYSFLAGDQPGADGSDPLRAVFDCLIDNELIPEDATFDEFNADLEHNEGQQFTGEGTPDEDAISDCWAKNA